MSDSATAQLAELNRLAADAVSALLPVLPLEGSWTGGYGVCQSFDNRVVALPGEWADAARAVAALHRVVVDTTTAAGEQPADTEPTGDNLSYVERAAKSTDPAEKVAALALLGKYPEAHGVRQRYSVGETEYRYARRALLCYQNLHDHLAAARAAEDAVARDRPGSDLTLRFYEDLQSAYGPEHARRVAQAVVAEAVVPEATLNDVLRETVEAVANGTLRLTGQSGPGMQAAAGSLLRVALDRMAKTESVPKPGPAARMTTPEGDEALRQAFVEGTGRVCTCTDDGWESFKSKCPVHWPGLAKARRDEDALRARLSPGLAQETVSLAEAMDDAVRMKLVARSYMRRYVAYVHAEVREVPKTGRWSLPGRVLWSTDPTMVTDADPPGVARAEVLAFDRRTRLSEPQVPWTSLPDAVREAVEQLVLDNLTAVRGDAEVVGYGCGNLEGVEFLAPRGHLQAVQRWYALDLSPRIERLIEVQCFAQAQASMLQESTVRSYMDAATYGFSAVEKLWEPRDTKLSSDQEAWAETLRAAQQRERETGCTCDYEVRKAGRALMGFHDCEHAASCPLADPGPAKVER